MFCCFVSERHRVMATLFYSDSNGHNNIDNYTCGSWSLNESEFKHTKNVTIVLRDGAVTLLTIQPSLLSPTIIIRLARKYVLVRDLPAHRSITPTPLRNGPRLICGTK